ncbi:hypothetical protein FSW04_17090 [Baekduia soli]|uniref:Uncharacterized protein n=1 Tax=Baekduia soli TaxID=496014 RepID=A0A5B8U922_9ACTN|nr:hypothetical protein [Baekduia soli]QEC49122.1 hypothetical protein FSW04_17090 [Baekduia soli]
MDDFGWMLHDGTYTAVIWPFGTEEAAEAWRSEFCLPGFIVERVCDRPPGGGDLPGEHRLGAAPPAGARFLRRRRGAGRLPRR